MDKTSDSLYISRLAKSIAWLGVIFGLVLAFGLPLGPLSTTKTLDVKAEDYLEIAYGISVTVLAEPTEATVYYIGSFKLINAENSQVLFTPDGLPIAATAPQTQPDFLRKNYVSAGLFPLVPEKTIWAESDAGSVYLVFTKPAQVRVEDATPNTVFWLICVGVLVFVGVVIVMGTLALFVDALWLKRKARREKKASPADETQAQA